MVMNLAEHALRDASEPAFWEWGAELRFDARMLSLYGLGPADSLSLTGWSAYVHPEDRALFLREFQEARAARKSLRLEVRVQLPAGEMRVLLQGSPLGEGWMGCQTLAPGLLERDRIFQAFEFAGIGMALVSLEGRWTRVNRALCHLVGYSEQEMLGQSFQDITHPDDLPADLDLVEQLLNGDLPSYQMEKRYFRKDGECVWILLTASLVRGDGGCPLYFVAQIQDITERRRSQQALVASLMEKEAMLHEIHHRVKNNLQVVTSILSLQSRSLSDAALRQVFDECQSRIHCMAMIHERLYQNHEFSSIDLAAHLGDLVELCVRSQSRVVQLHLVTQPVRVNLDTAIPTSLVANEVLSNCLKHHHRESMQLWLDLAPLPAGGFRLEIRDDGPGFPATMAETTSLGTKLVRRLARQLRAEVRFENWEAGSRFELISVNSR